MPETIGSEGSFSAKLGSNLGAIAAKNRVKPWCETQNQAKRINEIVFLWMLRDQGVGGSNPLSPTNLSSKKALFEHCGP